MYSPRRHHHVHHSARRQIIDDDPPPRLYQVWKGRNKFIFGGRFIFGPDIRSLILTMSLILIPVILFWAFVAKGLIVAYSRGYGIVIVVFSIIFTVYIIVLLLMTSGRDPGIIPRNSQPPEPDDCDTSSLSTDWAGSQSSAPGIPLTKNVTINGIVVKVKYCQTCMLYRPPRCSHCSICNNCVERFDHHCPWVGQCIGKRNYRCFFMFVSSTTLLCLYILIACLMNLKTIMEKDECNFWKAIKKSPVSGILVAYTFVVCWFVGGLTAFHLYLIARNQTTYENFRYQYDRRMNPYNLGCADNFKEVFCSEIPHSRHNFRGTASMESSLVAYSVAGSYMGRPTIAPPEADKRQTADADEFQEGKNHVAVGRVQQNEAGWDENEDWDTPPLDSHRPLSELENETHVKEREKTQD